MTHYTHGTRAFAKNLALASAVAAALASGPAFLQIAVADSAVDTVVAVDKAGVKLAKPARVAYLAECVQNAYCQARLKGITDAAAKFGFEFKVFDANFNPSDQLKHVQNAVTEKFDGYILAPTAAAPACAMWKQFLVPTGAPVVTVDLPMCGRCRLYGRPRGHPNSAFV